jgi:hypothetical protein
VIYEGQNGVVCNGGVNSQWSDWNHGGDCRKERESVVTDLQGKICRLKHQW